MKKAFTSAAVGLALVLVLAAWSAPATPPDADSAVSAASNPCWGQATKVFAKMGMMGEHSSQQGNPRVGLRNLARDLADAGVIPDDSMASLGAFVASALGLSIDACM